jgi:hypothetical protein
MPGLGGTTAGVTATMKAMHPPRANEAKRIKAKGEKKRPFPGIWNAKDGPGPAAWRKHDGNYYPSQ